MADFRPWNFAHRNSWGIAAFVVGIAAMVFRIWVTATGAPPLNSDEATFGLVALHVLDGENWPVYLYGQHYMGTFESYVAAPIIWIFGPTTFALRSSTLILFALFMIATYFMAKLIYSRGLAFVTVVVLSLGSDRVIKDQLIADGSAELAVMIAIMIILLAIIETRASRYLLLLVAAWSFVAGLALWDHMLILPYLAVGTLALSVSVPRNRRVAAAVVAITGFAVGASPMVGYNLSAPFKDNSLFVLLHYNTVGSDASLLDRLHGGVILGVPLATGMCDPNSCSRWQLIWGPIYLACLIASALLAVRTKRGADQAERAKALAQLCLASGALITVLLYARSPSAADTPLESARYLAAILVSTPAVIWPMWRLIVAYQDRLFLTFRAAPLAGMVVMMALATLAFVRDVPAYSRQTRLHHELVQTLEQAGITRLYTLYWTCNRLIYTSRERIVCAVLNDDLDLGFNRYPPYVSTVAESGSAAYVAPLHSAFDTNVSKFLDSQGVSFSATAVAGYRIYVPGQAIHPESSQFARSGL